jgi:hypothetical protein
MVKAVIIKVVINFIILPARSLVFYFFLKRGVGKHYLNQTQRKRYRKEYEKIVNDKLEIKFNLSSKEEQEKLMEDLEKNP